jgi:hypothetical protein
LKIKLIMKRGNLLACRKGGGESGDEGTEASKYNSVTEKSLVLLKNTS